MGLLKDLFNTENKATTATMDRANQLGNYGAELGQNAGTSTAQKQLGFADQFAAMFGNQAASRQQSQAARAGRAAGLTPGQAAQLASSGIADVYSQAAGQGLQTGMQSAQNNTQQALSGMSGAGSLMSGAQQHLQTPSEQAQNKLGILAGQVPGIGNAVTTGIGAVRGIINQVKK